VKVSKTTRVLLSLGAVYLLPLVGFHDVGAQTFSITSGQGQKKKDSLSKLTDAELTQFYNAMKEIRLIPAFIAARKACDDARTIDDKRATSISYFKLRNNLLVAVDPDLKDVLLKLQTRKAATTPKAVIKSEGMDSQAYQATSTDGTDSTDELANLTAAERMQFNDALTEISNVPKFAA
jgi:hypothetical protein